MKRLILVILLLFTGLANANPPGTFQPLLLGGACSAPLDTVTGTLPKFAGGLRILRSAYTGFSINIRRSSDNATQDIGFSNCIIDTSAIATFCTTNNCFVTKVYDQSGNVNDISQGTAGNQPQIYNGSVVQSVSSLNNKNAIKFDGTAMFFQGGVLSTYFSTTGGGILSVVSSVTGGAAGGNQNDLLPFSTSDSAGGGPNLGYIGPATNTFFGNEASNSTTTLGITLTDNSIIGFRYGASGSVNSAYHGTTTLTGTYGAATLTDTLTLGKNVRPLFWSGFMPEWYFWNVLPSNTDTNIIANNMKTFYNLSWTNI